MAKYIGGVRALNISRRQTDLIRIDQDREIVRLTNGTYSAEVGTGRLRSVSTNNSARPSDELVSLT